MRMRLQVWGCNSCDASRSESTRQMSTLTDKSPLQAYVDTRIRNFHIGKYSFTWEACSRVMLSQVLHRGLGYFVGDGCARLTLPAA